jgi:multimeric flavodoxin WrbA
MFEGNVERKHEVERINITQYKVGGCLGCLKCQERKGEPGCAQNDDALTIFDKMIQADAIVYASPLYCWSFTSQIKPLIDRHFCLVTGYGTPDHNSLIGGKPAALLVTCAGPIEGNCDAIQGIFSGFSDYTKLMAKGNFILPFCTTPDAIGDKGAELAENLARAITE